MSDVEEDTFGTTAPQVRPFFNIIHGELARPRRDSKR
jgi:hypothetical protein